MTDPSIRAGARVASGPDTRIGLRLLQSEQLFRSECFVMDLRRRLDEVLQMCPGSFARQPFRPPLPKETLSYRVRKLRRYTNSQCFSSSTLMTPHLFFRPRTLLPSIVTVRSEPTTAKGIIACNTSPQSRGLSAVFFTHPDLGVDLNFLIVGLLGVEGVQADVVVNKFGANLHGRSRSMHALPGRHSYSERAGHVDATGILTFCLNVNLSSSVKLSDFAMIGTTFTTSLNFFNTTMSIARSECPDGLMKNSAQ